MRRVDIIENKNENLQNSFLCSENLYEFIPTKNTKFFKMELGNVDSGHNIITTFCIERINKPYKAKEKRFT